MRPLIKECKHCEEEFNANSARKRRVGGYVNECADRSVPRKNRYLFLDEVVGRCQMVNGLMITNQCRDHIYRFSKIGHLIERIDLRRVR